MMEHHYYNWKLTRTIWKVLRVLTVLCGDSVRGVGADFGFSKFMLSLTMYSVAWFFSHSHTKSKDILSPICAAFEQPIHDILISSRLFMIYLVFRNMFKHIHAIIEPCCQCSHLVLFRSVTLLRQMHFRQKKQSGTQRLFMYFLSWDEIPIWTSSHSLKIQCMKTCNMNDNYKS